MNYPKVSILILNWNGWRHTIECLESLYQITYPNYDAIVIDNGSEDDSIQKIKEWAEGGISIESIFFKYNPEGKPVRFIEYEREEAESGGGREREISSLPSSRKLIMIKNEQNLGLPKGWNVGIRYALKALNPDCVICANNDIVVAPDFLDELVKFGQKEPNVGVLGPMVYFYNETDKNQEYGGYINYWKSPFSIKGAREICLVQSGDPIELDWVGDCCMFISREVLTTVGLLDETFFMGGIEAWDICIRAKKQGFKTFCVPKSRLWHKFASVTDSASGAGKKITDITTSTEWHKFQAKYILPGLLTLMEKHWRGLQLVTATLHLVLSRPMALFLLSIRIRRWSVLKDYPAAVLDYLKWRISSRHKKTIESK